jgi:hypothetical protein
MSFSMKELTPDTFEIIQGNPAHRSDQTIPIAIGNVQKIASLSKKCLGDLFEVIQKITLTPKYPNGSTRNNHNGTHSARQARMFEILLSSLEKEAIKDSIPQLTSLEQDHLLLAAYLLRSGRIDESSHKEKNPDDYYTRSAMIYAAYAKQLPSDETTSSFIQKILINSCKPKGIRDPAIDQDKKLLFGWTLLCIVHELDLIRCFSKHDIETRIIPNIEEQLSIYLPNEKIDLFVQQLMESSKNLCEATGCFRFYDYHPGNHSRFIECSANGKRCWEVVSSVF